MPIHNLEFDQWYGLLLQELKSRGYDQPPSTATAQCDFDLGFSPDRSADMFIKEWETGRPPSMGQSY